MDPAIEKAAEILNRIRRRTVAGMTDIPRIAWVNMVEEPEMSRLLNKVPNDKRILGQPARLVLATTDDAEVIKRYLKDQAALKKRTAARRKKTTK